MAECVCALARACMCTCVSLLYLSEGWGTHSFSEEGAVGGESQEQCRQCHDPHIGTALEDTRMR